MLHEISTSRRLLRCLVSSLVLDPCAHPVARNAPHTAIVVLRANAPSCHSKGCIEIGGLSFLQAAHALAAGTHVMFVTSSAMAGSAKA
jgi:hypothetical protein